MIWAVIYYDYQFLQVRRQDDKALIKAVHELSLGKLSKTSEDFIRSLNRPLRDLPTNAQPKYLAATRLDVDLYNIDKLEEWPGEERKFVSTDSGIDVDTWNKNFTYMLRHI